MKYIRLLFISLFFIFSSVSAVEPEHSAQDLLNAKLNFFVGKGDLKKVNELLDAGADINYRFEQNWGGISGTVISRPWGHRNIDMLALLLSRGLDPNIAGDPGQSPLVIDTWDYAFCVAIRPKDRDCQNDGAGYYRKRVSMLLDFGADPNFIGNNPRGPRIPLVEAVRAGDFSLVKRMLSMGADPNKQGGRDETALMVAANMRNFEIMDFLLDNGADVDIKDDMGRTVVDREHYLSSKSSSRVVVHLLDNNRITNINAHALAYAAVGWRDSELLERVLSMGADANMRPPRGEYTPLISAIISKFSLGVEILLQHGASPTLPELDKDGEVGETPLEIAEKLRNARIIQLIRSYMDKEIRD